MSLSSCVQGTSWKKCIFHHNKMNTAQFVNGVKNGELDIVTHTHHVIEQCRKINKENNFFNVIAEETALQHAEALQKEIHKKNSPQSGNLFEHNKLYKLLGVAVSVKDSICVKDVESTAGSAILQGYKPLFDATVVQKIKSAGGIIIGKTSQDEFGFGSFSINVGIGYHAPKNPFDPSRSCGGSSGGAAGITQKADFPHIALGESTGGSIASPASFCGVFGLCPTYGRVSRYGLIDYANSLDKVGPMGKSLSDVALMLEIIAGHDENDSTSLDVPVEKYTDYLHKPVRGMKVAIITETFGKGNEPAVEKHIFSAIEKLKSHGVVCEEISLDLPVRYGLAAYYIIATSEASTNLAKYCGMRYGAHEPLDGNFNDYFANVRSKYLGAEAKRRIMLGTFARMSGYREAYYLQAQKIRTLIIAEYKKAFERYDALICPSTSIRAPTFEQIQHLTPLAHYMMDTALVGPNLAGLPHLGVPVGFEDNLPCGMLFIGDHLNEGKLIQLAGIFEK